jgi:hypothetical protein
VVHATTGTNAGIVGHDLPDFELVIAQTIPSITRHPRRAAPLAQRGRLW